MRTGRVIAFGNARLASSRCPRKMIRPFAGTSLTRIALERLSRLKGFDGVYFAACDEPLVRLVELFPSVALIRRSRQSASVCNPISAVHDYLRDLDFDHAFWINSCLCQLRPETINDALTVFRDNSGIRSMTAVVKTHDWYYTLAGRPVNNLDPTCVDTKRTPPLLAVCHAFHCFSKAHFFATDAYWGHTENDPFLYEIDPAEAVDVDTELDFQVAEQIYLQRARRNAVEECVPA